VGADLESAAGELQVVSGSARRSCAAYLIQASDPDSTQPGKSQGTPSPASRDLSASIRDITANASSARPGTFLERLDVPRDERPRGCPLRRPSSQPCEQEIVK
jgi:hypothetical protein